MNGLRKNSSPKTMNNKENKILLFEQTKCNAAAFPNCPYAENLTFSTLIKSYPTAEAADIDIQTMVATSNRDKNWRSLGLRLEGPGGILINNYTIVDGKFVKEEIS